MTQRSLLALPLVVLAACSGGATTSTSTPVPATPETVTLRGRATLVGGASAAGADVTVTGTSFAGKVGADGSFAIPGVTPGIHGVELRLGDHEEVVPGVSATATGTFIVGSSYAPFGSVEVPRAHRLASGPSAGCAPLPSPDLSRVAYCEGSNGDGTYRLAVQALPRGTPAIVATRVAGGQVVWSNDGSRLYFIDAFSSLSRLGVLSRLDVASGRVVQGPGAGEILGLASDGKHVTFVRGTTEGVFGDAAAPMDGGTLVHWFPLAQVELRSGGLLGEVRAITLVPNADASTWLVDHFFSALIGRSETAYVLGAWNTTAGTGTLHRFVASSRATTVVATGVRSDVAGASGTTRTAAHSVFSTVGTGNTRPLWILDLATGGAVQVAADAVSEQFTGDGTQLLVLEDPGVSGGPFLRVHRVSDGQLLGTLGQQVRVDASWVESDGKVAFVDQQDAATGAGRLVTGTPGSCSGGLCTSTVVGPVSASVGPATFLPGAGGLLFLDPYRPSLSMGTLKFHAGGVLSTLGDAVPATLTGEPEQVASAGGDAFFFRRLVTSGIDLLEQVCRGTAAGLGSCHAAGTSGLTPIGSQGILFLAGFDPVLQVGRLQLWRFGAATPLELHGEGLTAPRISPTGLHALSFRSQPLDGSLPSTLVEVAIPQGASTTVTPARGIAGHVYPETIAFVSQGQVIFKEHPGLSTGEVDRWFLHTLGGAATLLGAMDTVWYPDSLDRFFFTVGTTMYARRIDTPTVWQVSGAVPEGFTFADALFDVGQGHFVFRARGEGSTGTLLSVSTTLPVYDTIIPPIASSPLATAILGRVSDFTLWSDLARTRVVLFAERSGTPSPYGFQDGTYVATLP